MSGRSSSRAEWSTLLEPAPSGQEAASRPDDPPLGAAIEHWHGDEIAIRPGRPVMIGFPQDEGVKRNGGRPGAAEAPNQIRSWLTRLSPWDAETGTELPSPLDLGNVGRGMSLEAAQSALGQVVAAVLCRQAIPIVLGGGHETAYGHYLGYVACGRRVGVINIDAHLDVRPVPAQGGTSGTPFRQMIQHPTQPLPGNHYTCLGVQPHATSRALAEYALARGVNIRYCSQVKDCLKQSVTEAVQRLGQAAGSVFLSIDADAARTGDVPGVSAPNALGLSGDTIIESVRSIVALPMLSSLDVVEINPDLDRDGQSARWGAILIWNFLAGLRSRDQAGPKS
jgi:formiminoglutamase